MAIKRGLGSGLSALLENNSDNSNQTEKIELINLENIKPNENQPRRFFDAEKLNELAESIKKNGVIQPIIVQKNLTDYTIIAGERRYRASKLAGLNQIQCIVKNYTPENLIKVSLIENIQREDLNPIEEAETFNQIIEKFNITQETLASEMGKSRTYITNSLRLLKLCDTVKNYIIEGNLSYTVARTLITLEENEQIQLAQKIIKNGLTARDVEKIVNNTKPKQQKETTKQSTPSEYLEIEKKLKNYLGTKVKINHGDKVGKIEINYFGNDDLERILNLIENTTLWQIM